MKKIKILFFALLFCSPFYAQVKFTAGMGIDLVHNSSLEDYINTNFFDRQNELRTFNKALSLLGEINYELDPNYQLGIEYNHFNFFHTSNLMIKYELNYTVYKPSVIVYYVIPGDGYEFKFGAGAGYRYAELEEKKHVSETYTTSGAGFLLKACGNTALGGNMYAYIGIDLRYEHLGEPEKDGVKLVNAFNKENLNLNSFSFGMKLGVSYFID